MKQRISKVLQTMGYSLQAEHAGEKMCTRCKSELLLSSQQSAPTRNLAERSHEKNNPVKFHIVPSLIVHK